MKLKRFYNKKVNIVTKEGIAFSGVVTEYFYTEENESGKESMVIDSSSVNHIWCMKMLIV